MDLHEFKASLALDTPPAGLSGPLAALWQNARGDWHAAHRLAQSDDGEAGAWVHAYLHRVEGDLRNAAYWYRRAGRPVCEVALEAEWEAIATALLGKES
jgi:hypothetical protein